MRHAQPHDAGSRGPLPLSIGVVGHRDLRPEDQPRIEKAVAGVLDWLKRMHPHTPLLLVTSLAEGADQLAARVGLSLGCDLQVALPCEREQHEREITTPEGRAAFRELMGRARLVSIVPELPADRGASIYERLAAYQARHAHVMLALWNGHRNGASGGTAETVTFALEGIPERLEPDRHPLAPVETGPVIHLVTPRLSEPSVSLSAYDPRRYPILTRRLDDSGDLVVSTEAWRRRLLVLRRIEQFNRDAVHAARRGGTSPSALLPADVRPEVEPLVTLFEKADAIAVRLHDQWLAMLRALCGLAGTAVLSVMAFGVRPQERGLLVAYLVTLLFSLLLLGILRAGAFERRFLDYRCLAEGLRVQIFWRLAGLPFDVVNAYLRKQNNELQWIRLALRVGAVLRPAGPAVQDAGRVVLERWIADQASYFGRPGHDGRAVERGRVRQRLQQAAWVLYGMTLVLALLVWAGWGHDFLVVLMALGPASYSLIQLYLDRSCLSDEAQEYAQAGLIFSLAEERMRSALARGPGDARAAADVRQLVVELGRDALIENGDWLLLHRKKPVEFIPV